MGIEDLPAFTKPTLSEVESCIIQLEQLPEDRLCQLTYRVEREYRNAKIQRVWGYILGVGCVLLMAKYDQEGATIASAIASFGACIAGVHGMRHLPSYKQEVENIACSKIKEKRGW